MADPITRTVRVTRIWDVKVVAEYGDTDQALLDKAIAGPSGQAVETKNLVPDGA